VRSLLLIFSLALLISFSYPLAADPSLEALRSLADHGDVKAQFRLGKIYEEGIGVTPDPFEAARRYRQAAELGSAEAAAAQKALNEKKSPAGGERNK
jgi:TPR repeat protein